MKVRRPHQSGSSSSPPSPEDEDHTHTATLHRQMHGWLGSKSVGRRLPKTMIPYTVQHSSARSSYSAAGSLVSSTVEGCCELLLMLFPSIRAS
ncbi:hypothetical protein JHW43_001004 [Diplocarpon mali]|nr:hypothetical protein JHW43_001004 [Diplocarpon mali]